jgi:hypothetical protein
MSRRRCACLSVLGLVLGLALVGPVLAQQPEAKEYPSEVYFDFRGTPLPPELALKPEGVERYIKSEPEGLRVTLPKDRKNLAPFELSTRVTVQGDFEITAALQILSAETPRGGFGVGTSLFINKVDPPTEGATLGRLLRPGGKDDLFWDQGFGKPGQAMQYDIKYQPCTDNDLRLRLKRTGSKLSYALGPGLQGTTFVELEPKNFGANDLEKVLVRVTTGRQPHAIDARLVELRIRSGRAADPKDVVAVVAPDAGPRRSGTRLLLVGGIVLLALVLAMLFALWQRRALRLQDAEVKEL